MLAILQLNFNGRSIPRDEFIRKMRLAVSQFVDEHPNNPLAMLVTEIAKNIYDHADGIGSLKLFWKRKGACQFEVSDHLATAFDFDQCMAHSVLAGTNDVNFGLGLGIIKTISSMQNFEDFTIDTSAGFKYQGTYYKSNPHH